MLNSLKLIATVTLSLFVVAAKANICPEPNTIKVEGDRYVAVTKDGKWVSVDKADTSSLIGLTFWHVRGQAIGNPTTVPTVKVNKIVCAYFLSNMDTLWLTSPGYPAKKYSVNRSSWMESASTLSCMSSNVSGCEFTEI